MLSTSRNKTFFIGLGAQKSGTSWIAEYLRTHPNFFMPDEKELHIFDKRENPKALAQEFDVRRAYVKNIAAKSDLSNSCPRELYTELLEATYKLGMLESNEAYIDYFMNEVGEKRVFGEFTPSYCMLKEDTLNEMKNLFPNVKVCFIMRDPIERVWSQINLLGRKRVVDVERIFNNHVRKFTNAVHRSRYNEIVPKLDRVFGEDCLFLFYETLFSRASIEKLCNHISIDYVEGDFSSQVGKKNAETRPVVTDEIKKVYASTYAYCQSRFKEEYPKTWLF